jgi:predicted outer membrane lipoprotein
LRGPFEKRSAGRRNWRRYAQERVSVYQVEVDGRVVIPYADLADALHHEQAAGPLIILCTALAAGFAVFMALWREGRRRRHLAVMAPSNDRKD